MTDILNILALSLLIFWGLPMIIIMGLVTWALIRDREQL